MKRRIISILLAVIMVVSYLPIVNAAGEAKIIGIFVDGVDVGLHSERKISKNGGRLEVIIKTENIEKLGCLLKIDNDKKPLSMWDTSNIDYSIENMSDGFKLVLNFNANDTEKDVEYIFNFKEKKYSDTSLKVIVTTKDDEEPAPNPNPGNEDGENPAPNPNPDQGSEIDKPEILGFVVDGGKIEKNIIKALGNDGGNYSFVVQTKGITDVNDLIVRVKMGTLSFARGISNTKEALGDGKFKVNFAIEKNGAKSCRVYKIDFGILTNSGLEYIDGIKSTINVDGTENKCVIDGGDEEPEKPKQEGLISFINDTDSVSSDSRDFKMAADESEKTFYITLVYGGEVKNEDIKITVRNKADISKIVDVNPIITSTGEKNKRIAKLTFPKNTSNEDIVYDISFKLGSKNTKVSLTHEKTLEVKKADIQIFSLTNENIPLEGGNVKASVFGENFEINKFEIKVFEDDKDVTDTVEVSKFDGREDTATADIKFPKSEVDKVYTIKLYYDGIEKSFAKLKQDKFGSNKEAMMIQANRVVKIGNQIVAEFVHDIFEAYPGALKEQTEIAFDGTITGDKHESKYIRPEPEYEKLKEADKVEVVGNKIIVTLAEDIDLVNAPRIRFGFRTFTNPDGVFNGRNNNQINSYFINVNSAVITSADIVSGDLYLSEGGDVEVKIFGNGLTNDKDSDYTRARIIKNEKFDKDGKQTKLEYTISGQGSEQVLKFKVPENKTDRTESYTISLSTDGRVYSPDVNATANDRANLLVVSVLPKGKTKDDMTLGFARIQSYGTSGGSTEAPDITHTIPPKGQESKKTWVTIYGSNLKNPGTKIRAKAEVPAGKGRYVYWYPVNEGTQDSGDKFIMVGVSKGLYGSGNVQMLEVIAPRGYRGDITYIYEIAIDGENYDTELTTTVLLEDDGEDQTIRQEHEKFARNLPIKYQDTEGNEIKEAEEIYVMKNMTFKVVGIDKAPEIDGYKYKELKGINKDLKKELAQLDALRKLQEDGSITEEQKNDLLKLEQWIKDHRNIEFETKIGDIKELIFVYEKIEEDQPETPEDPEKPEQPQEPQVPTPDPYYPGYIYEPSPDYLRDYSRRDEKPVERKEDKKEEKPVEGKKDEVPSTEVLSPIDVMAPSLPVDLPDVNGNPAIIDMVARGIFKGMGSGKFEPDTTITRAMVTEVFMRISRDKSINQNIEFTDVKADDWFSSSVKWAADKNIVTGFEDGSFKANQKVTIQEFAAMLDRLITKYNINLPVVNLVNKNDFEYINEWSRESVIKMVEFGLINLDGNGKIDPNREFKRVEIAEALYKLIKFIEEN